jgi:hypothetical protein
LLFGPRRQEEKRADEDQEDDNQNDNFWHGRRFCRAGKPLYSPYR